MSELIRSIVEKRRDEINRVGYEEVSLDRAFSYVILQYVFGVEAGDQADMVTDGGNDGGIDFVYYDEDESKVILGQSKYTSSLSFDAVLSELDKMYSTVQNFKNAHTGLYNERLRNVLQNALDRLPDDNLDNIEYDVFTSAPLDISKVIQKFNNTQHRLSIDCVKIFSDEEIEKEINTSLESLNMISEEKIKLDKAKNFLEYESARYKGIMCNVLSSSIVQLYNKYAGRGLFDLNIRKYIKNNLVDSGIKSTLDKNRENFWFLNNGIIIACGDYEISGNTVRLYDFSIVNGGQTTTLISTYKGTNTKEFYIPCKIVATKEEDFNGGFFTEIAEATNSQKPILPRDLKSNNPEMLNLARQLELNDVYMEYKRGMKPKRRFKYSIKNDELAQLILSFAYQCPGTSRSGKKAIFENNLYAQLFKVNYFAEVGKKGFLLDIIDLFDRYKRIEKTCKENGLLNDTQLQILKNGRQILFALMGVIYRLVNRDVKEIDLQNNPRDLKTASFAFSKFISNYHNNDLDEKLKKMIIDIVKIVTDAYLISYQNKLTTSVSNYFKTDSKYYDEIVSKFANSLSLLIGEDLKSTMDIFKR